MKTKYRLNKILKQLHKIKRGSKSIWEIARLVDYYLLCFVMKYNKREI